jgi:LysR family transcriptional regulator, transcriptional activator of nhaA
LELNIREIRTMNLKHLRYFWAVARFEGVARAAEKLELAPQTLSGQIAELQVQLGVELLRPVGRRLELTEAGRLAYSYADEIFGLADELRGQLQSLPAGRARTLRVGLTDGVPRSLAHSLLAPVIDDAHARLACSHEALDRLLSELALHRLDLVIADRPIPAGSAVKAFNHALGESGVGLFATDALARRIGRNFPRSLHRQPLLLPGKDTAVHREVVAWLESRRVLPRIVGEFDDSGLMKSFGAAGSGAFPAPLALRAEVEQAYGVRLLGAVQGVVERYFAITTHRREKDPVVRAVIERAAVTLA